MAAALEGNTGQSLSDAALQHSLFLGQCAQSFTGGIREER